jgi:hypothetical protein
LICIKFDFHLLSIPDINKIFPNDEGYPLTLQALQHIFGEVVSVLRSLSGFHFSADTSSKAGLYFVGFSKAFTINSKKHPQP